MTDNRHLILARILTKDMFEMTGRYDLVREVQAGRMDNSPEIETLIFALKTGERMGKRTPVGAAHD